MVQFAASHDEVLYRGETVLEDNFAHHQPDWISVNESSGATVEFNQFGGVVNVPAGESASLDAIEWRSIGTARVAFSRFRIDMILAVRTLGDGTAIVGACQGQTGIYADLVNDVFGNSSGSESATFPEGMGFLSLIADINNDEILLETGPELGSNDESASTPFDSSNDDPRRRLVDVAPDSEATELNIPWTRITPVR